MSTLETGTAPVKTVNQPRQDEITAQDEVVTHNEKNATAASADYDLAATWLASYDGARHEITEEESRKVARRIDAFLMPVIFYIYFCQQLDKSAISFASIFGFAKDANLHGQEYSWLGSIVYFAQLVFQPLSVYALVKFPVNRWLCFCFLGWGASCMILAAFHSFAGLAVFRFILGAFEASISPTMLVVVSMWWTRREQPLRNNIWYSANGVATCLGSLIAFGLGHITHGALHRYQYIFLVTGAIALLLFFPTLYLFPAHPTTARWLTDDQKYIAVERIRLNNTGTQNTHFKWDQVRECVLDPKTWGWVIMIFCISLVSGGIGTFGPLIIQGFGFDAYQTILFNMIPGPIQIAANIITALIIQYTKYKAPVLLGVSLFPLAAAGALYGMPRGTQYTNQLLGVYYVLQIFAPITSIIFSWSFANTAGHTKKTTTTGMIYIGLTVGNIVGPQLYKTNQQPYYHTGLIGNLVVLCIMFGVIILQALYLHYLNRRNIKRRIASGKTSRHVDYSLEAGKKWKALRARQAESDAAEGHHTEYNARAFEDLTDMQNADFVYSL